MVVATEGMEGEISKIKILFPTPLNIQNLDLIVKEMMFSMMNRPSHYCILLYVSISCLMLLRTYFLLPQFVFHFILNHTLNLHVYSLKYYE